MIIEGMVWYQKKGYPLVHHVDGEHPDSRTVTVGNLIVLFDSNCNVYVNGEHVGHLCTGKRNWEYRAIAGTVYDTEEYHRDWHWEPLARAECKVATFILNNLNYQP